jgi:RNA polymerase sigma factor (sigma-70 family)
VDCPARHRWVIAHILPHEAEVRGWLRRHVRSLGPADIDDVIQESYSRLYHADFERIASGRSYLFTVVRNLLQEQARHARIVPMERLGEIEALRIPSDEPGLERKVGARQELARLEQIVEGLPEQCKRAFQMQKFAGLSVRDIASAMQITEKTVAKHLATALFKVGQAMKFDCLINEAHSEGHENDMQSKD